MLNRTFVLVLVVGLALAGTARGGAAGGLEAILDSVVTISGGAAPGRGFVVTPTGFVVTTYCAVAGAGEVEVTLRNGSAFKNPQLICRDPAVDLAILKLPARDLAIAPLGNLSALGASEKIVGLVGNPSAPHTFTAIPGTVVALADPWDNLGKAPPYDRGRIEFYQLSTPVVPADSGAPLLRPDHTVGGIQTSAFTGLGTKWFAVPLAYLVDVVALATRSTKLASDEEAQLKAIIERWEAPLDIRERVTSRKRRSQFVSTALALFEKQRAAGVAQGVADLPEKIQKLAKLHPDWSLDVLKAISERQVQKGMTKDMIRAMFGKPAAVTKMNMNGQDMDIWTYTHVGGWSLGMWMHLGTRPATRTTREGTRPRSSTRTGRRPTRRGPW